MESSCGGNAAKLTLEDTQFRFLNEFGNVTNPPNWLLLPISKDNKSLGKAGRLVNPSHPEQDKYFKLSGSGGKLVNDQLLPM